MRRDSDSYLSLTNTDTSDGHIFRSIANLMHDSFQMVLQFVRKCYVSINVCGHERVVLVSWTLTGGMHLHPRKTHCFSSRRSYGNEQISWWLFSVRINNKQTGDYSLKFNCPSAAWWLGIATTWNTKDEILKKNQVGESENEPLFFYSRFM